MLTFVAPALPFVVWMGLRVYQAERHAERAVQYMRERVEETQEMLRPDPAVGFELTAAIESWEEDEVVIRCQMRFEDQEWPPTRALAYGTWVSTDTYSVSADAGPELLEELRFSPVSNPGSGGDRFVFNEDVDVELSAREMRSERSYIHLCLALHGDGQRLRYYREVVYAAELAEHGLDVVLSKAAEFRGRFEGSELRLDAEVRS